MVDSEEGEMADTVSIVAGMSAMAGGRNAPVDLRQSLQWHVIAFGRRVLEEGGAIGCKGRSSRRGMAMR
jgi:hypothetical protein